MEASKTSTKKSKYQTSENNGEVSIKEDRQLDWHNRIATAAYYKAEARSFEPGHDIEDWLAAEAEEKDEQLTC
ncbi:MAG TPA: DUF2934 domain-containing protein [Nitrosomonas sp.]|nr:DUF2934 domain-containing protein [Nitrosomonas sp.]HMW68017.1 DUF2934 domain-containing protein [Nitrosomonas sp.]HMY60403.1 DUF2934 domain-containing protein [Nitrosomonas sp.]HMY89434.1 DUF2934 domain-containing protein [Nitrosomonas sp.]HNA70467.1 DUF2934 domain-containing protein [Nitrosomonas sp.]